MDKKCLAKTETYISHHNFLLIEDFFHLNIPSLLLKSLMKWNTPETLFSNTLTYVYLSLSFFSVTPFHDSSLLIFSSLNLIMSFSYAELCKKIILMNKISLLNPLSVFWFIHNTFILLDIFYSFFSFRFSTFVGKVFDET